MYADGKLDAVETPAIHRTPGTGGVTDLWKNRDGTPSKLATGRWAQGQGKPQGVGKRWRGWYVGDDGKQRTKRFRTEVEAEQWVSTERGKVVTNQWVSPDVGAETFGAVAEQWLQTKGHRKPKTLAGYRSLLDTVILPDWRDEPLKAITYARLSTWLSGLSTGDRELSASRIRQAHQLIGAVYKFAIKAGLASVNPAAEFDRRHDLPEERETERHYLTLTQLLDLATETGRFEGLTSVLGFCGLRFGEAVALRGKDIGDCELIVRRSATYVQGRGMVETDTKTKRSRHVPVPQPVWELLTLPDDGGSLLFPGKNGFLTIGEYRWVFDKAVTRLREAAKAKRAEEIKAEGKASTPEFPQISPHALRHTCASLAISSGANVKVVQRMLGHATAAMTLDLYGHLFGDDLAGVATMMASAIEIARKQ